MLYVHEDDSDRRRFVLRKRAGGASGRWRQVAAGAIASLPIVGALALMLVLPRERLWQTGFLLLTSVFVSLAIAERFATELLELGFDGAAGTLWWRERKLICKTRRTTQPLTVGDGLAFRAGLLTGRACELGVVLELAGQPATPCFVIDGVESRADLEQLVERVAGRMGRQVLRQRDDIDALRLFCGAEGPTAQASRTGSYRDKGGEAPLELGRHSGFEAPSVLPPPLLLGESEALADALSVTGPTELTLTRTKPPFRYGPWLLGGGYVVAVVGATLLAIDEPLGEARWAEALVFFGICAFVVGIRTEGVILAEDAWHAAGRALHPVFGPPRLSPPPWGAHRVRQAALRAKQLDLALTVGSVRLTHVDLVLLRRERRRGTKVSPDPRILALWSLAAGSWYMLAETRPGDLEGPGAATLRRVAFEIAKTFEAPLRVA